VRIRSYWGVAAVACASMAFGAAPGQTPPEQHALKAHADIFDSKGNRVGAAELSYDKDGLRIDVRVANLPPGTHGTHVHEVGKCEGPKFLSAGGHLNPEGKQHGMDNPQGFHAGDLPNLEVGRDGRAHAVLYASRLRLDGNGPNSVFRPGGTSLVIHKHDDDYASDPTGASSDAIACGVIVK
jgi:superoxide dismutase, Cu-Zn family